MKKSEKTAASNTYILSGLKYLVLKIQDQMSSEPGLIAGIDSDNPETKKLAKEELERIAPILDNLDPKTFKDLDDLEDREFICTVEEFLLWRPFEDDDIDEPDRMYRKLNAHHAILYNFFTANSESSKQREDRVIRIYKSDRSQFKELVKP